LTPAWDTTLVSQIYPGSQLERDLLDHAAAGEPIAITAPTIMEVIRGLHATAATQPKVATALPWFIRLLTSELVERSAAILAGRLRAIQPTPPTGTRRKGTKPEQRAGWILDIQIAACTWTHGRQIATENRNDFHTLSNLIAKLYPDTTPLTIVTSRPDKPGTSPGA
jgi:predicted nucleic acid-binding protein